MEHDFEFLKDFPRDQNGMMCVWEVYSFDNIFRLLLKADMDYDDALMFMLAECDFSAVVWQERIHNEAYAELRAEDAPTPELAALWVKTLQELVEEVREEGLI